MAGAAGRPRPRRNGPLRAPTAGRNGAAWAVAAHSAATIGGLGGSGAGEGFRAGGGAAHSAGRVLSPCATVRLPEGLADSKTGQLLEGVCEVDLDALDVELPRGFGRD